MATPSQIPSSSVRELISRLFPENQSVDIRPLSSDAGQKRGEETSKGFGYGEPLHIVVRLPGEQTRHLVLHTAHADQFGHDRRSDRAQAMLLAADTFGQIPRHVAAIDVGAIDARGHMISLGTGGEFYLLTEYAPGRIYAQDLRRIAHEQVLMPRDRQRCDTLATYLAGLHVQRFREPVIYQRAIRDLVGHGEGIFGLIDGYPADTPAAPAARLQAIEAACCRWRWRLRERTHRLTRTHGDFHPFNILFDGETELHLLDASRGCRGDAADDVCCLAINYIFFALGQEEAWRNALGELWQRFWTRYLTLSGDNELLEVAPPYLTWRALVLANPTWYPAMQPEHRDALLGFVERILASDRFQPADAEELFS